MTQGLDGSTYTYDAQNRLTQATRNGVTMSFTYDGLNRQVRRVVTGGPNPGSFYSVWDGWDLIEEYQRINDNWTATSAYVYGATGLIAATYNGQVYFHFQDASGSTSHLTDASGVLREWYRYDLQGAPMFYDANNNQLSASAFGVRHLFTGQQWYPELGLYDLRNRFYSPDLGRFLQPDPIGFWGGRNLYRYCRNNPVTRWDPFGLNPPYIDEGKGPGGEVEWPRVTVWAVEPVLGGGGPGGGGPGGEPGIGPHGSIEMRFGPGNKFQATFGYHLPPRNTNSNTLQQPPPQNPPPPGVFTLPTELSLAVYVLQAVIVTLPGGEQYMPMTTIKNAAQARVLGRFIGSPVPIFVPPGVNPQAIINRWAIQSASVPSTSGDSLASFYYAFRPGGPYDFKLINPIFDASGNFIYGASATSAGYPSSVVQGIPQLMKGGQNDPVNIYDIQSGIDAMMMGGTITVVPVDFTDF